MSGKTVARTAWDNAKSRLGMHYSAGHLVYSAVATYGYGNIHAIVLCF